MSNQDEQVRYESEDILSLSDCEHIRTRPTLYIGTVESPLHCVSEIIFNAIDEAMISTEKKPIDVSYDTKENILKVSDQFRGIPIGQSLYKNSITGETTKVESLQLLFMTLNSGGKMGSTKAYSYSAGLHGQGTCIVNSLSEHLKVTTYRNGKAVELITSQGNLNELNYLDTPNHPSGVSVEFVPDKTIFDSLKIPKESLINLCAVPNAFGIKINLTIDDEVIEMPYTSLKDLLPELNEDENEFLCHEISVNAPDSDDSVRIIFRYTSATNTMYRGYANMLHQSEGGSHVRYFEDVWKKAWQKYLTDGFRIQDVFLGLRALIAVTVNNSSLAFSNQVKSKLTTPKTYFSCQFDEKLVDLIHEYFDTHDTEREGLIKRFTDFRQAQNKMLATKELSQLVYINESSSGNIRRASVVDKLIECTSKDRKDTILFIVEGDSASQGLIETRNLKHHAILPLRGKTLNVAKRGSDIVECVKNNEVRSIVNSAGTGVGEDSDHKRSRYEQYRICCFTGDTKVRLLDGTVRTFEELVELEKQNPDRDYWLYSVDENGNFRPGRGYNPRCTGYTDKLVHVILYDGCEIKCTPEHLFLTENLQYVEAQYLVENQSLISMYFNDTKKDNVHKVKCIWIEKLEVPVAVYDLTVDEFHNFLIQSDNTNSGIVVHNCDSDADGLQISALITSIYINLLPDIVKAGMLYIIQPPLYGWTDKQGQHYTNDLKEVTNLNTLHRYKGLGEFDADELYNVCVENPLNMLQVQYPDDLNIFNEIMTSSQAKFRALFDRGLIKYT